MQNWKSPLELKEQYTSTNKINSRGDRFEFFIKDSLSGTLDEEHNTISDKEQSYSNALSWTGSQNEPPDIIIRDGDAVEVKNV